MTVTERGERVVNAKIILSETLYVVEVVVERLSFIIRRLNSSATAERGSTEAQQGMDDALLEVNALTNWLQKYVEGKV